MRHIVGPESHGTNLLTGHCGMHLNLKRLEAGLIEDSIGAFHCYLMLVIFRPWQHLDRTVRQASVQRDSWYERAARWQGQTWG